MSCTLRSSIGVAIWWRWRWHLIVIKMYNNRFPMFFFFLYRKCYTSKERIFIGKITRYQLIYSSIKKIISKDGGSKRSQRIRVIHLWLMQVTATLLSCTIRERCTIPRSASRWNFEMKHAVCGIKCVARLSANWRCKI